MSMKYYIVQHRHSEYQDPDEQAFERTYISDDIGDVKRLAKAIAEEFALKVVAIDHDDKLALKFLSFDLELDDILKFGFKGSFIVDTNDPKYDLIVNDTVKLVDCVDLTADLIKIKENSLGNNGFNRMIELGNIMSRLHKEEEDRKLKEDQKNGSDKDDD